MLTVRAFAERDVEAACGLTNHFIEETAVHFGLTPQTCGEFATLWRGGMAKYPWLAAEVNGRFAGYAKAGVWRTREAYAPTAEVTVYVALDRHRRGVGRALYAELIERLRAAGFHSAIGGITLPNDGSVRLHEAMGFTLVGVFREAGWKFERWHDTAWYQLML